MENQQEITEKPAATFERVGIVKRVNDDLIALEMDGRLRATISQEDFVRVVNGEIPFCPIKSFDEIYGGERTDGYVAKTKSGKGVLIRRGEGYYVSSLSGVVKVLNHGQSTTSISRRV